MQDNTFDYVWGGFFGLLVGYMVAKVYQSWAILFLSSGIELMADPIKGWDQQPLWVIATKYPTSFSVIVSVIFGVIGILFTKYLRQREKLIVHNKTFT
ncbi:MAG: hypothetical protein LPK00_02575 [Bacillaceae bacterium]|nr:hypothetical protein [Bacillaceae bacterium]